MYVITGSYSFFLDEFSSDMTESMVLVLDEAENLLASSSLLQEMIFSPLTCPESSLSAPPLQLRCSCDR